MLEPEGANNSSLKTINNPKENPKILRNYNPERVHTRAEKIWQNIKEKDHAYKTVRTNMKKWYGDQKENAQIWKQTQIKINSKPPIQRFKEILEEIAEQRALERELKSKQLKRVRKIQLNKHPELEQESYFCPLVENCYKSGKADLNCFLPKTPGCSEFINYLEKTNTYCKLPTIIKTDLKKRSLNIEKRLALAS